MNKGLAEKVLFEGEADNYAAIINDYAISHNDCMEILKVVARLKNVGYSNDLIIARLTRK